MKATLLAIATQRSALIERMQKVASTRPAAANPIPSVTEMWLIECSFLRSPAKNVGWVHVECRNVQSRDDSRLGLMRQLSRTRAAARSGTLRASAFALELERHSDDQSARLSRSGDKTRFVLEPLVLSTDEIIDCKAREPSCGGQQAGFWPSWILAMNESSCAASDDYALVRFSTEDYAPQERLEAMHEICGRNLQNVLVESLAGESFHAAVTLRRMPGLSLYTASRSEAIYRRSRHMIEHDDVIMIAGFTSSYEVHHLGRAINLGCGEGVILTGAEPASFGGPDQKSVNLLRVPKRLLSPFVTDLEATYGRSIPANNPALQLLVGYLRLLEEAGTYAVPELRRQAVTHIHDLIALTI